MKKIFIFVLFALQFYSYAFDEVYIINVNQNEYELIWTKNKEQKMKVFKHEKKLLSFFNQKHWISFSCTKHPVVKQVVFNGFCQRLQKSLKNSEVLYFDGEKMVGHSKLEPPPLPPLTDL